MTTDRWSIEEGVRTLCKALDSDIPYPLIAASPVRPTEENFQENPGGVILYLLAMQAQKISRLPDPVEGVDFAVAYICLSLARFDSQRGDFERFACTVAKNAVITALRRQVAWKRKVADLEEELWTSG